MMPPGGPVSVSPRTVASRILCKRSSGCFWVAALHLNLSAAVGAVGTVGKRSLFFHGFHSPVFWVAVSFRRSSPELVRRQAVFVNDREAIERGFPILHRHGPFLGDV